MVRPRFSFPLVLCLMGVVMVALTSGARSGQKPGASLPNMWCLSWHCSSTMYRCMTDLQCRDGLFCLQGCGTNSTCTFECVYRYNNENYVKFLQCAVTKNQCVVLKAEHPPYRCKDTKAESLKDSEKLQENLVGSWKFVKGLNKFHDCQHGCRKIDIKKGSGSGHFHVEDNFLFRDESVKKSISISRNLKLSNDGKHTAEYSMAGLNLKEDWKILVADGESIHVLYCGYLGAWQYDGAFILQKPNGNGMLSPKGYCSVNHNIKKHCTDDTTEKEL